MFPRAFTLAAALGVLATGCLADDDPNDELTHDDSVAHCLGSQPLTHYPCLSVPINNGQKPKIHWDFAWLRPYAYDNQVSSSGIWGYIASQPDGDTEIEYLVRWGLSYTQGVEIGGVVHRGQAGIYPGWINSPMPDWDPNIPYFSPLDHHKSGKLATLNKFGNKIKLLAGDPVMFGGFNDYHRDKYPVTQGAYAVKAVQFEGENIPTDYGVVCHDGEFEQALSEFGVNEPGPLLLELLDADYALAKMGREVVEYAGDCASFCTKTDDGVWKNCTFPVIGEVQAPITIRVDRNAIERYTYVPPGDLPVFYPIKPIIGSFSL